MLTKICYIINIGGSYPHINNDDGDQSRLDEELRAVPKLKRYWKALKKREKQPVTEGEKGEEETRARERAERDSNFLTNLIQIFLQVLSSIPKEGLFVCGHRMYSDCMYVCVLFRGCVW